MAKRFIMIVDDEIQYELNIVSVLSAYNHREHCWIFKVKETS